MKSRFFRWLCTITVVLIISVVIIILTTNSAKQKINNTSSSHEGVRLVLLAHIADDPYWLKMKQGAEDAASKRGCIIEYRGPESPSVDEETKLIDMSIASKANGIITCIQEKDAAEKNAYIPNINKAVYSGIPVITVDTDDESSDRNAYVGSDNIAAGKIAAKELLEVTGNVGDIGIVRGGSTSTNEDERIEGFEDYVKSNSKMKILEQESSNSFEPEAEIMTKKILSNNPSVKALLCTSSLDGIGAAKAVNDLNLKGKVTIICFDAISEIFDYVKDGTIYATIVQKPYDMGYQSVNYMMDLLEGKKVSGQYYTDFSVVTKENVDKYKKGKEAY